MSTADYVIAITSVGDTREGLERLCAAIEEINRREEAKSQLVAEEEKDSDGAKGEKRAEDTGCKCSTMKQVMTISQAMECPVQQCFLKESIGKISAEFVYLYPPGIPIIVPGEQITGLFLRDVRRYMEQGLNIHGLCGEENELISVVKEQTEN